MERQFENKVAIVTGGSFGIGKATAIMFAQRGAKVVVVDWNEDQDTLKTIQAARRVDALVNRLFLEPSLGLGYQLNKLKFMRRIEKYMEAGYEDRFTFDFDFIGV